MGKVFHRIIQRFRKSFNERTASGRTCLVQLYTVNGLIFDFDAFHILAADIENTVYIRFEECGGVVMSYRLHFTLIQHESCLDQGFSVSGRAGVYDFNSFRKLFVNIFNSGDSCSQRISVIVVIERIEQRAVFAYKSSFCGCRAGIDSQECLPAICCKILYRNLVFCMAGNE